MSGRVVGVGRRGGEGDGFVAALQVQGFEAVEGVVAGLEGGDEGGG